MTDTASSILLTREQSTGSNTNLWGTYLVTTQRMTEQASKGYQALAVTGDATISWTNYVTGNTGECVHLKLTGSLSSAATLTFPSNMNWLSVNNQAGATVTIKCSGGTGVAIPNARRVLIRCDGVDFVSDTSTWTGDSTTLTNNGDLVNYQQAGVLIAAAIAAASISAASQVLVSVTDTTPKYLATAMTINVGALVTTQVAGLTSFSWATLGGVGNQQLALVASNGYVESFLPGGNKSAKFTPVVGTEYNCDFTASSWTVNIGGMTTPQVNQKIKLNCFGNFPPFLNSTFMGQSTSYLAPGSNEALTWSSTAWGFN